MQHSGLYRRFLLVVCLVIATVGLPVNIANAAEKKNCLIETDGVDANGNLIIISDTCYATFAQVLLARGFRNIDLSITPDHAQVYATLLSGTIGIHYEHSGGGGASMTVTGSDCNGGGLNVSAAWNDRISSTWNGCPSIWHYENSSYGGSIAITYGVGSTSDITGYMNDRTTSIKYYP